MARPPTMMTLTGALIVVVASAGVPKPAGAEEEIRVTLPRVVPHVRVMFDGIDELHARAVARTVEIARAICVEKYGFEMPDAIRINIEAKPGQAVRLFNDGVDTFSLSLRSEADLRKPATSAVFHLYGLCHEVGHLAMYRPIKDHGWLSTAGGEGWAHYLGSVLVDEVYAQEGPKLWPDVYDYRADGIRRLDEQLAKPTAPDVARGARLWRELARAIGPEKVPVLFAAWGRANVNAADPVAVLKEDLEKVAGDAELAAWWEEAGSLLFVRREASRFPKSQIESSKLTGSPRTLSHDDGKSAGKASIAGSGHAVRFSVPDGSWYLTAVEIYGSRYGSPAAPKDNFHVWLCDEQMRAIADFEIPYAKFERGDPTWVKIPLDPTKLPTAFVVCVGFNPNASKGVFVHYDAEVMGHLGAALRYVVNRDKSVHQDKFVHYDSARGSSSLTGLPGAEPSTFSRGDWMIRARVDQTKDADALAPIP